MTTVGLKAVMNNWNVTGNIGAGASVTMISSRILCWISSSVVARLEGLAEDGSTWVEFMDRVGTIRATGATIPTVLNGHLPTSTANLRYRNQTAGAIDMKIMGWMMA
jgi:hypothetical protein